jgi:hypothetical protein
MTQVMTILEAFFAMRGLSCLRLDGSTSSDEREKRMFMFNDPDSPYFIFLLSTRAGGLGLNLATADTVILFDSDWNPMMDAQAQDRAHRIGQKNEVRVFRLVTTSVVEERILARATDKRNLNGLVVEAGKFNNAKDSEEADSNKAMVESLLKEWSAGGGEGGEKGEKKEGDEEGEVDEEIEAEVPDDEQINEMMSTHDDELILYQTMDRDKRLTKEKLWLDHLKTIPKEGKKIGTTVRVLPVQPEQPAALMGALEKPFWLQASSWSHKHSQLDEIMMGNGDGTFIPRKKGNKGRKRKADSLGEGGEAGEGDEEDDIEGEFDEEEDDDGVLVAGKMMRKRKEGVTYDDHMTDKQFLRHVEKVQDKEDAAELKEKQDRRPVQAITVAKVRKTEMVDAVTNALLKAVKEVSKLTRPEDGSVRAALFLEKPDRKIYPDYYMLVPRPLSFKDITIKIKKKLYTTLEEAETDFALMSHNARMYNLDTSPVFAECESLREEFHKRTAAIRQIHLLPTPPPFAVDIATAISPILLDENGINIAIPVPVGTRPPLPDRTKGHFIYTNGLSVPKTTSIDSLINTTSNFSSILQQHKYDDSNNGSSSSSSTFASSEPIKKKSVPKSKRSSSPVDPSTSYSSSYTPEKKKSRKSEDKDNSIGAGLGKRGGEGGNSREEKLVLSLSIPKKLSKGELNEEDDEIVSETNSNSSSSYSQKIQSNTTNTVKYNEIKTNNNSAAKKTEYKGSKVKLKGLGRWPV